MSDGNPLTNLELGQLVAEVVRWVNRSFSPQQAFQIATTRLGFIGRITERTFAAHAQSIGMNQWVDEGAQFAQSLQSIAPALAGFMARARFAYWNVVVRTRGWWSPRAGAVLLGTVSVPYALAGVAVLVALGVGVLMVADWGKPSDEPIKPTTLGNPAEREIPIDRFADRNDAGPLEQSRPADGPAASVTTTWQLKGSPTMEATTLAPWKRGTDYRHEFDCQQNGNGLTFRSRITHVNRQTGEPIENSGNSSEFIATVKVSPIPDELTANQVLTVTVRATGEMLLGSRNELAEGSLEGTGVDVRGERGFHVRGADPSRKEDSVQYSLSVGPPAANTKTISLVIRGGGKLIWTYIPANGNQQ